MDMNRIYPVLVALGFAFAAYAQGWWMWDVYWLAYEAADPSLVGQSRSFAALQGMSTITLPESLSPSPMDKLSTDMLDAAKAAVTLAISLVGAMTFFLGLVKVGERGGLLVILAKLIRPVMVRLFPDVPPNHPAMGAMILNMSANALGLGNAATPFGIRAMQELDKLNPVKGTTTNAMALFLAINTSSITLLPTGVIAVRAAFGSEDAGGILPTTLFATLCSTTVAIVAAKAFSRLSPLPPTTAADAALAAPETHQGPAEAEALDDHGAYPAWVPATVLLTAIPALILTVFFGKLITPWVVPLLVITLLGFGVARGVPVYEALTEGAKDGFQVAIKIIPYLVAILVAVAMLRSSGVEQAFVTLFGPATAMIGMPAEVLPMAVLRPLSGSGAYGVMASIIESQGVDSYAGYLVSTMQGSTETTFYVLAVYFGAVGVHKVRHAVAAAICADIAGVLASILACRIYLGV